MPNDITLREPAILAPTDPESFSQSFFDRLATEPALRYQVRDALGTFSIEPHKDLGLGYTQRPFAHMPALFRCLGVDASLYPEEKLRSITGAFMYGCAELRDDFTRYRAAGRTPMPRLDTFIALPTELQYLGAFKVMERASAPELLATEAGRATTKSYFTKRLGLSASITDNVLGSAAIIDSPFIIASALAYPAQCSVQTTGVHPGMLIGPTSDRFGIYLGQDLVDGVNEAAENWFRQIYNPKYLADGLPDYATDSEGHYEAFWPEINRMIMDALSLTDKPESQRNLLRSYLFMSAANAYVFAPHIRSGFDGDLDQLASWHEPVADDEYRGRFKQAAEWLRVLEADGHMDSSGVDMANYNLGVRVVEQLEREVINMEKADKHGRLAVVALIIKSMQISNPDLATKLVEFSPILGSLLKKQVNPWGYRFEI